MTSFSLRRAVFGAVMLTGVLLLGCGCSRDGAKPAGKPLAWLDGRAVGLIDCFAGFSTFAARPLLNVHDFVVINGLRGQGIGKALLAWAEQRASQLGCCKLTLEVLSRNSMAMACYTSFGFAPYVLDPKAGNALLMQKTISED